MIDSPTEVLAARPLLEQVARMGDCIGANTVGEIMAISDRAAAWLRENPPGQPAPAVEGEVAELVAVLRDPWIDPLLRQRTRAACLLERQQPGMEAEKLPPSYIDPEHSDADRELLEVFYLACCSEGGTADEIHLRGIRAVLARQTVMPVPVAVSERLPGPGDCDAEGQVWQWDGRSDAWVLYTSNGMSIRHAQGLVDYWLSAHALPLPGTEVEG